MSEPIRTLLAKYADGVCRRDGDAWGATWAPDGIWDLGGGRKVTGRDEIVPMWLGIMNNFDGVLHQYADGWADLDQDAGTGTGRWYVYETLKPSGGDPMVMIGFYDDEYIKVDGQWHFASRGLTPIYRGSADMAGEYTGFGL
jgi:hypothetical protein